MRRVKLVLAVGAVMVAMLAASETPAMADVVVCDGSICNVVSQESESGSVSIQLTVA